VKHSRDDPDVVAYLRYFGKLQALRVRQIRQRRQMQHPLSVAK
jgi:hypothetical protein